MFPFVPSDSNMNIYIHFDHVQHTYAHRTIKSKTKNKTVKLKKRHSHCFYGVGGSERTACRVNALVFADEGKLSFTL